MAVLAQSPTNRERLALVPNSVHPTLYTPHRTPYTRHQTPNTLHPTPHPSHPSPYTLLTLQPTPYTLHPALHTLHPATCPLQLAPYTLLAIDNDPKTGGLVRKAHRRLYHPILGSRVVNNNPKIGKDDRCGGAGSLQAQAAARGSYTSLPYPTSP